MQIKCDKEGKELITNLCGLVNKGILDIMTDREKVQLSQLSKEIEKKIKLIKSKS